MAYSLHKVLVYLIEIVSNEGGKRSLHCHSILLSEFQPIRNHTKKDWGVHELQTLTSHAAKCN